jgi:ATP-dependent Clp protease ATP-binding subunit ClpA
MFIFYLYQSRRRGYTTVLQPGSIAQSNKKKYIDISRSFSKDCLRVFEAAFRIARLDQGSAIQSLHIFSALLANDDVKIILGRLGVDYSALAEMVQRTISGDNLVSPESQLNLDSGAEEVVLQSYVSAYEHRRLRVEVAEVLEAVVRVNEKVREILFDYEITQDKDDNAIAWIRIQHALQERYDRIRYQPVLSPGGDESCMTAIATPL